MSDCLRSLFSILTSFGLVVLPVNCRGRGSNSSVKDDEAKLNQVQGELKNKILEFFSDKVYPGWTFKAQDPSGALVPITIEQLISGQASQFPQFVMFPPPEEKQDLAIQIMPMETNLETGQPLKVGITVSSAKNLKIIKARDVISIDPRAEDPEAEAARIHETFKTMQSQIEGKKTGQLSRPLQTILELLVPTAYGKDAMQRAFRAGLYFGLAIFVSSLVLELQPSGKTAKIVTLTLCLGSIALMLLAPTFEYIIYGSSVFDDRH